jgi:glucose/arabinose dehydrogenase
MSPTYRTAQVRGRKGRCAWSTALLGLSFLAASTALAQPSAAPATTRQDLQRPSPPLGAGPWTFETAQQRIRVSVVATGLVRPWSVAFLPNGDLLVAELPGRLRLVRGGRLDPEPIGGVPAVHAVQQSGLKDIALHPNFAATRFVYLVYVKPGEGGSSTTAIARGRLDGHALRDVRDIFVADAWTTRDADTGARLAFDRDGLLYVTLGDRFQVDKVQDPASHFGKVLRLRDDGSVPPDNPFVGKPGHAPEVYTLGHRNAQGLAVHPETGALWSSEHGPQGGDELNVLVPGGNYGWPLATHGVDYGGAALTATPVRPGMESPRIFWVPGIYPSGLAFYTGQAFPAWRGSVFIGSMGRAASGHLLRVVFDAQGLEVGQEPLLTELEQRIRDVRQGPDGLLYVLTDEEPGALLKIEPADDVAR